MLMSKELVAKLKEFGEDKTKIVIEGFNGLGDTFTTKGKIAKGDESNPVVYENVVFLDFGHREGRPYSELVASFLTECEEYIADNDLIVARISLENGEVLFENKDIEKYMATAKTNMAKYEKKCKEEGRWIDEHDAVSEKLMTMVGRPFRLNGKNGVLTVPPRKAANSGDAIVNYKTVGNTNTFIDSDSCLESVNLDTEEFEFEVSNGLTRPEGQRIPQSEIDKAFETKMRTEKLIWLRKEKIEAVKKPTESEPTETEPNE